MFSRTPGKARRIALFAPLLLLGACLTDEVVAPSMPVDPISARRDPVPPRTRVYYIAADEVPWNYAPAGYNQITGLPFDEAANVFVENGPTRIGSTYIKAQYREYTDATFATLKEVAPEWRHLGVMGPAIRAQVGDTVMVFFKNKTSLTVSMHPHGVFYDKCSEGAPYDDGANCPEDDAVPPNGTHTYVWLVPERAGPASMDGSSIMWMYHSHTDEAMDTNAGLIGPIIVTRKGSANANGDPVDVDREFVMLFTVFDENVSWYLDRNVNTFATKPAMVKYDDDFYESNLMHSINGYVFGNQPLASMTMKAGERVRWYLMSLGTEVDLHTPHWHGQTAVVMGMRTDIVELLPASMKVADMWPDNAGTWLFHCHVNDHITAGMLTRFAVVQ